MSNSASPSSPTNDRFNVAVPLFGLLAAGFVVFYLLGYVSEAMAALVLSGVVGLVAAGVVVRALAGNTGVAESVGALTSALLIVALAVGPAVVSFVPGAPLVTAQLRAVGDKVTLPANATGPVRLLVHGSVPGGVAGAVGFSIRGFEAPVAGELGRSVRQARVGRRGSTAVAQEWNEEYLQGTVPSGTAALELATLSGPLDGGLEVRVFADRLPRWLELSLALATAVLVAVLAARRGQDSGAVVAACVALGFGLMVYAFGTPTTAVHAEIGGLIVGGLGGAIAGGALAWVARKIVKAAPRPTGLAHP